MSNKKIIEKGNTYGRLTVIEDIFDKEGKYFRHWVICRCSCERKTIKTFLIGEIKFGETKSCGCLQNEINKKRTDKKKNKPFDKEKYLYKMWSSMKTRCNNKNIASYKNYGGRDITYSENWERYEKFREDMLDDYLYFINNNEYQNPSLERIDVNGNYCKENCTFIPFNKQAENTRVTIRKFIAINPTGDILIDNWVSRFARENGLKQHSISTVLNGRRNSTSGWKFEYLDSVQEMSNNKEITIQRNACSKENIAKEPKVEWYHPDAIIINEDEISKIYVCPNCKIIFKQTK